MSRSEVGGRKPGSVREPRSVIEPRSVGPRQAAVGSGTYGERPAGIFGGMPVSEVAILAGLVALIIGTIEHGGAAVAVGILVMALGVTEVTAREHLSGFRSHTTLLAFMLAVIVGVLYTLLIGVPRQRILLVAPMLSVFAACYWGLNRKFRLARHARVVKHD